MEDAFKRHAYIYGALIAGLIACIIIGAIQFGRWGERHYYGEVRSVSKNRIVISDPTTKERSFFLAPDVAILHGNEVATQPVVGDRVSLIVRHGEDGQEVAVIRIFDEDMILIEPLSP